MEFTGICRESLVLEAEACERLQALPTYHGGSALATSSKADKVRDTGKDYLTRS